MFAAFVMVIFHAKILYSIEHSRCIINKYVSHEKIK